MQARFIGVVTLALALSGWAAACDPSTAAGAAEAGEPQARHDSGHPAAARTQGRTEAERRAKDEQRKRWNDSPLPAMLFELAEKPPSEQERILQATPSFRAMPAEQQDRIRHRLKRISEMSADERAKFKERYEIFHHLPAETREKIRADIWPVWKQLPHERRHAMLEEFRVLYNMNPQGRQARYSQDAFKKQFSNDEQQMLKQLVSLTTTQPVVAEKH